MKLFGRDRDKGESKKEKQEREKAELRAQLKPKLKPKKDPAEAHKAYLEELKARTYRDYAPQPHGLKLWWVLGFDKKGEEHYDGPCFSASEADKKLTGYDDGEIFELRDIETKSKAREAIKLILKERQEEEHEFLQGRLSSIETPRRALPEVLESPKSPNGRFHLPFPRNGKGPG